MVLEEGMLADDIWSSAAGLLGRMPSSSGLVAIAYTLIRVAEVY